MLCIWGLSGRYGKHPWAEVNICQKMPGNWFFIHPCPWGQFNRAGTFSLSKYCGHLKICLRIERHEVNWCADAAGCGGFIWQVQEASLGAGTDRRAELMELKQAGTIPSLPPPLLSVHTTHCNNILNATTLYNTTKHQHNNITITSQHNSIYLSPFTQHNITVLIGMRSLNERTFELHTEKQKF